MFGFNMANSFWQLVLLAIPYGIGAGQKSGTHILQETEVLYMQELMKVYTTDPVTAMLIMRPLLFCFKKLELKL